MSYILDSLRKADRERQQRQVPDLQTDHEPPGRRRRPLLWILLLSFLALQLGLTVLWLRPWQDAGTNPEERRAEATAEDASGQQDVLPTPGPPEQPRIAENTEDHPSREAATIISAPDLPHAPGGQLAEEAEAVAVQASGTAAMETEIAEVQVSAPDMPTAGAEAAPLPAGSPEPVAADGREPAAATEPEEARAAAGLETAETAEFAEVAETAKIAEAPSPSVPEVHQGWSAHPVPEALARVKQQTSFEKSVPDLLQLPAALRSELPELHISAHVYSPTPASRLISLNGRILREKQSLDEDLKVAEITVNGVIFEYRDRRFFKPVF